MNFRTRIVSALVAAAITPLLLTSCAPQANPNAIGSVSKGKGTTTTASPVTATDGSTAPTPTASEVAKQKQVDDHTVLSSEKIVKQAANLFGGINATKKHSQAEVLKALFSARLSLSDMQNRPEFLNGKWIAAGHPGNTLTPFASYFTKDQYGALLKSVSEYDTKDQARANLLLFTSYFPKSDGHYSVCPSVKGQDPLTCEISSDYPAYSNLRYGDAKDGGVYVQFDIENRYTTVKDGVKGYIPVTKTVKLSMVPNPDYSTNTGNLPYIINGWSGSYGRGSFAQ